MMKRFTGVQNMTELLEEKKVANEEGVLPETEWFKAYTNGLVKNYTPEQLLTAICLACWAAAPGRRGLARIWPHDADSRN